MDEIFEKVNSLLEKFLGGEIFFTEFDASVKFNKDILLKVTQMAKELYPDCLTIASGEIGLSLHNLEIPIDFLVPGNLRKDPSKINLLPFKSRIENKKFVFIDDSFYSGKTLAAISQEVGKMNGCIDGVVVAYDGSKEKRKDVHSIYRYYDYFDILGNKID